MAVDLKGLQSNARKASIGELSARMADASALAMAIKQAHWNMKGKNFIAVHEFVDQIYDRQLAQVDLMAERIKMLDGMANGTAEVVARDTTLEPYPLDLVKVEDHIRALCDRLRDHGGKLRKAIDTTDEAGDKDTADPFTNASREADKDLWFLESHLE